MYVASSYVFFALMSVLPVTYAVLLICDDRVTWRVYRVRSASRNGMLRPDSYDLRWRLLYILFPVGYMALCYLIGLTMGSPSS